MADPVDDDLLALALNPEAFRRAIESERREAAEARQAEAEARAEVEELAKETAQAEAKIAALQARLTELKTEEAALSLNVARFEVGQELGLDPGLVRRLKGTTPDELRADARELRELVSPTTRPPEPSFHARLFGAPDGA